MTILVKIPDDLKVADHKAIASKLKRKSIQGLSLSFLGGASGPVWKKDVDYDLDFLALYSGISALEIMLPGVTNLNAVAQITSKLEYLTLGEFKSNKVDLSSLGDCPYLRVINLCKINKNLDSFLQKSNVQELRLTGYSEEDLRAINTLTKLKKLYIGFGTATSIDLEGLSSLETLEIEWVKKLSSIKNIESCINLMALKISTIQSLTSLPSFNHNTKLDTLLLEKVNKLKSLEVVSKSFIKEFALIDCNLDSDILNDVDWSKMEVVVIRLNKKGEQEKAISKISSATSRQLVSIHDLNHSEEFIRRVQYVDYRCLDY